MRQTIVLWCASILGLLTVMSGCETMVPTVEEGTSIENEASTGVGGSIIDEGIVEINKDPSKWAEVLQKVAEQFPEEAGEKVRQEAQLLANRSHSKGDTSFNCGVDSLAGRAVRGLQRMKSMVAGIPYPDPLPPAVCSVSPSEIDLNTDPSNWETVTIHGYDLDRQDGEGNLMTFTLVSDDPYVTQTVPEDLIERNTHSRITLNLWEMAETLYTQHVSHIVPSWTGALEGTTSGKIVVKAWEPRKDTMVVELGKTTFVPPHVSGDRDFHTGPKDPTYGFVSAQIEVDDRTITGHVHMNAKQKRGDRTHAEGKGDFTLWDALPENKKIVGIGSMRFSKRPYIITRKGLNTFTQPDGQAVDQFKVYGAQQRDKANNYTRVEVEWRPVSIEVVETRPSWYHHQQELQNVSPVGVPLPATDVPSTEEVIVIEHEPKKDGPDEEEAETFIIPSKTVSPVAVNPTKPASKVPENAPMQNEPADEADDGFLIPLPGE